MAGPTFGEEAFNIWKQQQSKPQKKPKSFLRKALGEAEDLALPVALGAGAGFLAGGPVGAVIGGTTAAASSIFAPKVAKALPAGTPDWVRTGVEYGIYGATAPLGFGGAANAGEQGLARIAAKVALPEALKIGLLSGGGAAGGREAAKVLHAPPGVGEIVGSLGTTLVAPMAWRSAQKTLSAAVASPDATIGKRIGEALKIAPPVTPKADPLKVKVASVEHNIQSLRASADMDEMHAARYQTGFDDAEWIKRTGYTKADARAIAQGHKVGTEAQLYRAGFAKARRQLPAQSTQLERLAQGEEDAVLAKATAQDLAAKTPAPEGNHSVQQTYNKSTRSWETRLIGPDGNALPGPDGAEFSAVKGKATAALDKQRMEMLAQGLDADRQAAYDKIVKDAHMADLMARDARAKHVKARLNMADRLGVAVDALPTTLDEQITSLREKYLPGAGPEVPPEVTQADMGVKYREAAQAERAYIASRAESIQNNLSAASRKRLLAADMESGVVNFPGKAIPNGSQAEASRLYQGIRDTEELIKKNPNGFTTAREAAEPLNDYRRFALLSAQSDRMPGRMAQAFEDFFNKPRGTVYELDPATRVASPRVIDKVVQPPADFVRKRGGPSGWQAIIRDDQFTSGPLLPDGSPNPKYAPRTVPFESLVMRYNKDQLTGRAGEWAQSLTKLRASAMTPAERDQIEEAIARIKEPVLMKTERYFRTQRDFDQAVQAARRLGVDPPLPDSPILENNRVALQQQFASLFVPEENTVAGTFATLEDQERTARGVMRFNDLAAKAGRTKAEIEAHMNDMNWLRQSAVDRFGESLPVDDAELLGIANPYDVGVDPMENMRSLLGAGANDEILHYGDPSKTPLHGSTKQSLIHALTGQSVTEPHVLAVLGGHFPMVEAFANEVGAERMPILTRLRQRAAELADSPLGFRGQVAKGAKAAAGELPHPMRALSALTREIHPLSVGQDELQALMAKHFDPEGFRTAGRIPLADKIAKYAETHTPEQYDDMIKAVFTSNPATLLEMPMAYPKLIKDKVLSAAIRAWGVYDLHDARLTNVMSANTLSRSQKWALMLDKDYRSFPNYEKLEAPNSDVMDLVNEVEEAARGKGDQRPISALLTSGNEAALSGPTAAKHALNIRHTSEQIGELTRIDPETGKRFALTPDDISFRAGKWTIRSLNKFPEEMRDSLRASESILSGAYGGLEGVTRMSQQIALGTLAADLSLIGIHGFKVGAQMLLSGHPVEAVKVLSTGLTHIMTDQGFYSWLKTNHDDLSYLARNGLTGGLKGYIAGPDITRMPLETIPLLGKAFTGIREFSDLQFNRMLYYWKVESFRMNMEFAQNMRLMAEDFHKKFVDSAPDSLHAKIVDDMGGLSAYRYGNTDDLARATIRQINNSLGGIDMRAKGIGVKRQAVEQIAFIVPGFTRAQIGQWASILTKPDSIEGWMAASMVAREAMFGGSIALGLSRMLGTENQINWDRPDKPDWLAVHDKGGGYYSVMSTMAIPRLLSRTVNQTMQGFKGIATGEGGGFDYATAAEAFAHGRLSAGAGALYDAVSNKDFLGRKYDGYDLPGGVHVPGAVDRWTSVMEHTTLPIVMQSAVDDIKESLRSGNVDLAATLQDTGAQALGKSYVPSSPIAKLNTMAQQYAQTDWNLLTDAQKYALRQQNPYVAPTEAEYNFYTSRRATSAETAIDSEYTRYGEAVKHIWSDPMMISGVNSSQTQDDSLLQQGALPGDAWRDRYHRRLDAVSDAFAAMQDKLKMEGVDPDKQRIARLKKLAANHNADDAAWLVQLGKSEYNGVPLPTEERTVSTPTGDTTVQVADWQRFQDNKKAVLERYPPELQAAITAGSPDKLPGIKAYQEAAQWQKAIESTPRYRGLSLDQGDKLDQMRGVINSVQQQISVSLGLPAGVAGPDTSGLTRQIAAQQMQKMGLITSADDSTLATIAFAMDAKPQVAEGMVNPQQVALILAHPEAVVFYPYLQYRVPKFLRNRLPAQVQPLNSLVQQTALTGGQ